VDFKCGIKIPGILFQDQKYSSDNVQTIMKLMKQYEAGKLDCVSGG
jgi:hypothetical protein